MWYKPGDNTVPGLAIKTGMTSEEATAKTVASWDTVVLSGQMGVADFVLKVPHTVTGILSFGLCGGLAPGLPVGGVVLAGTLIDGTETYHPDYDWTARLAMCLGVTPVPYFSTGQFNLADTPDQRAKLYQQYGTHAIDDESGPMAEFAKQRGIPFAVMRVVSDAWNDTVPLAARNALNPDGTANVSSIIAWLEANPDQAGGQIWDLSKIALDYNLSLNVLMQSGQKAGQYFQFGV